MLDQLKESSGSELIKMRDDWDDLQQKVRDLEGQLDASQNAVKEISSERDTLRNTTGTQQTELQTDDQASLAELKKFLEQAISDGVTLSPSDLLSRFTEATEKSAGNLAKKAEVGQRISYPSRFTIFNVSLLLRPIIRNVLYISLPTITSYPGRDGFPSSPHHQLGKG